MNKLKKLKQICKERKDLNQKALMQELELIQDINLINAFYKFYKTGKAGKQNKINSLVAYALGITNKKPAGKFDPNKRFKSARLALPDIDLDFADHRRDEVINYVSNKYGKDHVAQIITFGTMAARASVRDAGRAMALPYDFCDKTAKLIPMFFNLKKALETVKELQDLYHTNKQAKKLLDMAQKLEGVVRHASTHACGVVMTTQTLDNIVPCQHSSKDENAIVSQYEMHAVEDLGLLKMDFLGLKNLTVIEKAINNINKSINFNKISLQDKKTFELLQNAQTTGVFQLESSGMKRYLKQLKPTEFEDIIAMVALYRPGPMEFIPTYIKRKHGQEQVKYLHPKLEPILKNTYGIAVYQEQVLQMARDLAGFSLGEADVLRKAVGKKIRSLLEEQREKFIQGCMKNKISKQVAEKLFSFIEPFASYGFNRAHAACYAMIGYRTAYLKAHWPTKFMAALLTADQENTDRIAIEIDECKELNIEVLPPDINESKQGFTVVDKNKIRFGLNAIKNVGHNVVDAIAISAPYKSLEDFIERVNHKDLNKKSLESLIKCGALDRFGERNRLLHNLEQLLVFAKENQKARQNNQASLFGNLALKPQLKLEDTEPGSKKQYLTWEKELLGLYVSEHPTAQYADYLHDHTIPIKDLDNSIMGQEIRVGGVISKIHKIITKTGQAMAFAEIEDETGKIEIIVFPRTLEQNPSVWEQDKVVLIAGALNNRDGTLKMVCNQVQEVG